MSQPQQLQQTAIRLTEVKASKNAISRERNCRAIESNGSRGKPTRPQTTTERSQGQADLTAGGLDAWHPCEAGVERVDPRDTPPSPQISIDEL